MKSKVHSSQHFYWNKKEIHSDFAYRQIPSIEWVDDKSLVSQVYNSRDTIARLQGCHGARDELRARKVLDRPMIITMFDVLCK